MVLLGCPALKIDNHKIGFGGGLIDTANDYVVIVVGSGGGRDDLKRSGNTGEPGPVDHAAVLVGVDDDDRGVSKRILLLALRDDPE